MSIVNYASMCCLYSWMGCSLGMPFIASHYINCLGETVDLSCYGPGLVAKISKTNGEIRFKNARFVYDLENSVMFPMWTFLGPLSIPLSIWYMFSSTLSYLAYVFQLSFCNEYNIGENNDDTH